MGIEFTYPAGSTPIDADEAQALIPSLSTQAELNQFEALNIVEGVIWAERSRKIKHALLEQETLKLLHRQMFGKTWKWAGSFRLTQKNIGCESWRIPTELQILTEDVRCWIEFSTYPPDEILGRFHHRLVSIHAFPNGNGRHARLATDILCSQMGVPALTWGSAEAPQNRQAYLGALRAADEHDYASLIQFLRGTAFGS
jgi:Fic-DOC domain mobile mystery protein B